MLGYRNIQPEYVGALGVKKCRRVSNPFTKECQALPHSLRGCEKSSGRGFQPLRPNVLRLEAPATIYGPRL